MSENDKPFKLVSFSVRVGIPEPVIIPPRMDEIEAKLQEAFMRKLNEEYMKMLGIPPEPKELPKGDGFIVDGDKLDNDRS